VRGRFGTRTAAKPTADRGGEMEIVEQLDVDADWRGMAAQERAGRVVSKAVVISRAFFLFFASQTLHK
jgi:hypothetical protein